MRSENSRSCLLCSGWYRVQFYVYRSLEGQDYRFPQYYSADSNADPIVHSQLHKMPEEEQYLQIPSDLSREVKDEITIKWIQKLIEM